jgi:hypothetical protein
MTTELTLVEPSLLQRSRAMSQSAVELKVLRESLTYYKFPMPKRHTLDLNKPAPAKPARYSLQKSKSTSLMEGIKQLLKKNKEP